MQLSGTELLFDILVPVLSISCMACTTTNVALVLAVMARPVADRLIDWHDIQDHLDVDSEAL
jgi:hypothetical protein